MSYTVCTLQYLQFAVQRIWVTCKTAATANCTNCIYKKGGTMTEYRFTLQKYKLRFLIMQAGATMNIRANTIISHRIISKIIPLYWKKGSHGSHKQKLCSPSQQITLTVTLCTARLPTTNGIRYSSFFQVYLVRKKHPGCSNYTVSGHPRNGEAPRCSGRLTDKEECEPERLCCIIR